MPISYHNKRFRAAATSANGQVDMDLVFHYKQTDDILTCRYTGEDIVEGHLIGLVSPEGEIDMRYHHLDREGNLMTGVCQS
ncbi:MAG: n-acetylglutamate synthase, partial [Bacteroidota bacterium]